MIYLYLKLLVLYAIFIYVYLQLKPKMPPKVVKYFWPFQALILVMVTSLFGLPDQVESTSISGKKSFTADIKHVKTVPVKRVVKSNNLESELNNLKKESKGIENEINN